MSRIPDRVLSAWVFPFFLRRCRGVTVGRGVVVRGVPRIELIEGGRLVLGDRVVLNSRSVLSHVNLHAPVKLFAEGAGALITIGEGSRIHGSCIHARSAVSIGRGCLIAANCQIMDCAGHDLVLDDPSSRVRTTGAVRPVTIQDHVWIGLNTIVLPGVEVGEGTVIGAGSVVTRSLPARVLAVGNPARVVGGHDGSRDDCR